MLHRGFFLVLKNRLAGIDTNLDDLQASIEACSRAANALRTDTTNSAGGFRAPLLRTVVQHVRDVQACARDQRAAMQELREGIALLQQELKRSNGAVRPPPFAVVSEPQE